MEAHDVQSQYSTSSFKLRSQRRERERLDFFFLLILTGEGIFPMQNSSNSLHIWIEENSSVINTLNIISLCKTTVPIIWFRTRVGSGTSTRPTSNSFFWRHEGLCPSSLLPISLLEVLCVQPKPAGGLCKVLVAWAGRGRQVVPSTDVIHGLTAGPNLWPVDYFDQSLQIFNTSL